MRFDPAKGGAPERIDAVLAMRAASVETQPGIIYAVSTGQGGKEAQLYAFNTRTEKVELLGPAAVGTQQYITALEADLTGRFLYYIPGAHGGADRDGSPVVQFDTRTRQRKVIAFLHPFYQAKYGCALKGTYSGARPEWRQALRDLECQPRFPCLGYLRADRRPHSGVRAFGEINAEFRLTRFDLWNERGIKSGN